MFSFLSKLFSFRKPFVITSYSDDVEEIYQATEGSSGYDLRAYLKEDLTISPGQIKLVSTALSLNMPKGLEAQVRSRSGLALKHGVFVLNSPGTIDSDYRGIVGVVLCNLSAKDYTIKNGERIAQLVFSKVVYPRFMTYKTVVVDVTDKFNKENLDITARGEGGFGSTGDK